ncbi:hypothetical protein Lfu02_75820 [Longispora fulva]|uniref:Secreted protein/lipoprotein n=1 Tax=Longispora fulva TaxID=619741 RepID=A0A8J7KK57_9ACTN|nr:hypothetical protein [Longispora fulva]MBG6136281.1 hypothetical protein [Longispora fulva]GIG63210.1 hypothetical protein Lfu02_75820 [Longispora fulva]
MSNLVERGLVLVALTLLPAVTACQEHTEAKKPTVTRPPVSTPAASSPSADPLTMAGRQAEDAYRGMWTSYLAASRIPDPNFPDLRRHASGAALTILVKGVQQTKEKGLLERGDFVLQPSVAALQPPSAPTKATVNDCVDTSATSMYKADGSPYQDTPGGKRLLIATLEIVDGTWKVVDFGLRAVGTCA